MNQKLILKPRKKPVAPVRNSMREVGQAMGGPTASFERKGAVRHFAARLCRNPRLREFSITHAIVEHLPHLVTTAGVHVGINHALRHAITKPRSFMQRFASSIYKAGQSNEKAGKQIHPILRRIVDGMAGPELGHIYEAGHHSVQAAAHMAAHSGAQVPGLPSRAALPQGMDLGKIRDAMGSQIAPKDIQTGSHILTGATSPRMDKILGRLPMASSTRPKKATDWLAAAPAHIATGYLDAPLAAMNLVRTKLSESSFGKRFIQKAVEAGKSKPLTGIKRVLSDYVVSPSIGMAKDWGTAIGNAEKHPLYGALKEVKDKLTKPE